MKVPCFLRILGVSIMLGLVMCVFFHGITYKKVSVLNRLSKFKPDWDRLMHERVSAIKNRCMIFLKTEYWRNVSPKANLYTYSGVTYCKTPKIGCTFWLQVFKFLSKDFKTKGKEVLKPSDIDRYQTHFERVKHITVSQFNTAKGNLMLLTTKSFMFTRHPLTRLWSAYIDKFFLPDFWCSAAKGIADQIRKQKKSCVSDISFEEFLNFTAVTQVEKINPHWRPVHQLCSPCHAKFDAIGKQETFVDDRDYIIDTFGLHGVKGKIDRDNRVRQEIEMLVKYNFRVAKNQKLKSMCFYTDSMIWMRLWYAFQMNGYIHRNISFPLNHLKGRKFLLDSEREFLETIFKAIDSHNSDMKKELKHQKRNMMVEGYKTIPRDLLDKIITIYKYDFELFKYEVDI